MSRSSCNTLLIFSQREKKVIRKKPNVDVLKEKYSIFYQLQSIHTKKDFSLPTFSRFFKQKETHNTYKFRHLAWNALQK